MSTEDEKPINHYNELPRGAQVFLYCYGVIDDFKRAGLLKGGRYSIRPEGRVLFDQMLADEWKPTLAEVDRAMQVIMGVDTVGAETFFGGHGLEDLAKEIVDAALKKASEESKNEETPPAGDTSQQDCARWAASRARLASISSAVARLISRISRSLTEP